MPTDVFFVSNGVRLLYLESSCIPGLQIGSSGVHQTLCTLQAEHRKVWKRGGRECIPRTHSLSRGSGLTVL